MAFEPKKIYGSDFNGGIKYSLTDGFSPDDFNNIIEGLLYAQENGGGGGGVDQELLDQVNANTQGIETLQTEKVDKTYYASASRAGLFKSNASQGIFVDENSGGASIVAAGEGVISSKTHNFQPIVPKHLDYAVKVGVTTNTKTLTDEEKTSACDWLGAVEKVSTAIDSNNKLRTYIINKDGSQGIEEIAYSPDGYAIARYNGNGNLSTVAPINNLHCANKKYVDDSIASVNMQSAKMYLHKIVSIQTTESPWGEIHFNLITSNPTPYTKESIINEKVSKMLDGTSFNAYVDLGGTATNYVRKSGVFYYDESNEYHGYMPSGMYGILVGMLFGDGSTATLMLDDHNETLTDEVIEL